MRARLTSTLFALSLLLTGCSHDSKPLTDADIAKKIVGTWKVDGTSPSGVSANGSVSILGDGSLTCNTKFLRGERELYIEYTSAWRVENVFLIETIKTTSNSNLLAVGFVTRDKILRLDNQKLVFEMENGSKVTRNRGK